MTAADAAGARSRTRFQGSDLSPPDTKTGRLQRECLACYLEHVEDGTLPTSGQFLWYELEHRGVVTKEERRGHPGVVRGNDQDVADALLRLREVGLIPWEDVVDETRHLFANHGWPTMLDGARADLDDLRLNPWGQQWPPLILCESRSLAGASDPIADRYCCPIAATNGQARGFLENRVGPAVRGGRPVLYFGDWDFQGGQIEAHTRSVLERFGVGPWVRLALTEEQVEENDLTVIQKRDRRFKRPTWHPAVETEALGQRAIVDLLRDVLDALLPEPIADVLVREAAERAELRRRLTRRKR
jgi:hypothetical protein